MYEQRYIVDEYGYMTEKQIIGPMVCSTCLTRITLDNYRNHGSRKCHVKDPIYVYKSKAEAIQFGNAVVHPIWFRGHAEQFIERV